jgi:hypothetical protein
MTSTRKKFFEEQIEPQVANDSVSLKSIDVLTMLAGFSLGEVEQKPAEKNYWNSMLSTDMVSQ